MSAAPEPVVYGQGVDGLLRGLGDRMTPALEATLRRLGVDVGRPLLPSYPQAVWFEVLRAAGEHGWPSLSEDERLFELGKEVFRGFSLTLVGRAILKMFLVLGPKRSLARLRASFRAADNYTECTLLEQSPTSHELWLNQPQFNPHYVRGLIVAMLEVNRAAAPQVTVSRRDRSGVTYQISWT